MIPIFTKRISDCMKKLLQNVNKVNGQISDIAVCSLKIMLILLSVLLLLMNILCFSDLVDNTETVEYHIGIPVLKILFCASLLFIMSIFYNSDVIDKMQQNLLEKILFISAAVGSILWIFSAYDVPKFDPFSILDAAEHFLANDYSALSSKGRYLQRYPFQLPFSLYVEQIYRITGPGRYLILRLLNVLYVIGIYKYIINIFKFVIHNEKERKLAVLLLFLCWQPVFLSTFIYPLIPSLLFYLMSVHEFMNFYFYYKKRRLIFSGLFLGMSILLKSNMWIGYIAFSILIILIVMRGTVSRQIFSVLLIALSFVLVKSNTVKLYYECQSGYQIEDGTPNILWVAMGLQESNKAPGWYNGFPYNTLKSVDFSTEKAAEIGRTSVKESIDKFVSDPMYAIKFFLKKELSQWCEPTYECFNLSYNREHEKPLGNLALSMYVGTAHELLLFEFHSFQIICIFGFLIYCVRIKIENICFDQLIIPLTILGGFIFHTFWEGKSQYIFPYYMMMIPFSISGLLSIFESKKDR